MTGRLRLYSDEERALRRREAQARWRIENKDEIKAASKKYKDANRDKVRKENREYMKKNYLLKGKETSYAWAEKNREKTYLSTKKWREKNTEATNTLSSDRAHKLKEATPRWLTDDQLQYFEFMKAKAKAMTTRTGIRHVVDHVIPLRGKNVRGLHVPWNLQILTNSENSRKSNKVG